MRLRQGASIHLTFRVAGELRHAPAGLSRGQKALGVSLVSGRSRRPGVMYGIGMSWAGPRWRTGLIWVSLNWKMPPSGPGRKLSTFLSSGALVDGNPRGLWQCEQFPSMYAWAVSSYGLRGVREPSDFSRGRMSSAEVIPEITLYLMSRS